VLVGGQPAAFTLSADGQAVLLQDGLPAKSQDVVVRFRKPASHEVTAAAD
jgi:hypothetical protein